MTIIVRSGREWMRALVSSKERPVISITSNSGFKLAHRLHDLGVGSPISLRSSSE